MAGGFADGLMGGNPTLSNTVELFQRGEGGIHVYKEKQFVAV